MSTILKLAILIIIIGVIVSIIWAMSAPPSAVPGTTTNNNTKTQNGENTQTYTDVLPASSPTDNSDAALSTDLSSIDSQLNNLNVDIVAIDQSLSQ